ncbi:E3 ubiquitin-protein ligase TRAIP [Holothuria leucospilota]|uniref:E3 ubiquitin-protein ligase TRAIP n=1 Tax=Holothuria leucospilota TaxID=206669 RepID=A0A9Q0YEI7_HOLLE|nr:E3 ubiquitin-protein ligase TRAIP [Holothuria leucospilota]
MPSVQCSICAECLELDHQAVCACPCGHVYHEICLKTWFETSQTCPLCREKATQRSLIKLFFEGSDEHDPNQDPAKLKNALDEAKLNEEKLIREKSSIQSEADRLSGLVDTLNSRITKTLKLVKQEQTINDGFRRQLAFMTQENEQAKECKKETKRLREKVKQLERFERMMTENKESVEDMIRERGECTQASRELATYCIAIKQEFETSKQSRRKLQEEIDRLRRDNAAKTKQLMDSHKHQDHLIKTVQSLKEEVQTITEDKQEMQNKMKALEGAMKSNGASLLLATPKLSRPRSGELDIDLEEPHLQMPGCPDTPDLVRPSPSIQTKKTCEEFNLSYVKTTSKAKKVASKSEDRIALQSLANSCLFNKNRRTKSPGKLVKGFDGLGGHRSFVRTEAMKRSLPVTMEKMAKKAKSSTGKLPAFPSMENILD